ncbi:MAG: hypothetical protein HN556_15450 [Gammaproteobacteria bacterium]|jgi:hypothetical protein|nr:hypothetical protein [Gammaproteobacteria bacterium]
MAFNTGRKLADLTQFFPGVWALRGARDADRKFKLLAFNFFTWSGS